MQYNTSLKRLILPEYGRNVQQMVDHCLTIEDRDERNRCARRIVSIMANLFPEKANREDHNRKLWDHLNVMAEFKLDVDFPCEVITQEQLNPKPDRLPYNSGSVTLRHYGRYIETMVRVASDMPDSEERREMIWEIANFMKQLLASYNPENAEDRRVIHDLLYLSQGAIDLDPEIYRLNPVSPDPERPAAQQKKQQKKKKKKNNNNQNRQ